MWTSRKVNVQGAEAPILRAAEALLKEQLPALHVYYFPKIYKDRAEPMLQELRDALSMYKHICNEDGTPFDWAAALDAARAGKRDGRFVALPKPLEDYGT